MQPGKKECFLILKGGISIQHSGLQAPLVASKPANGRCLNTLLGWTPFVKHWYSKPSWALSTGGRALSLLWPLQHGWICVPGVSSRCTVAITPCTQTQRSVQYKPRQPSHLFHQPVEEGFKFCCFCTLGESCALQSWCHCWRRWSAGGTGMKGCLHTVELTKPLLFLSVK